MTTRAEEETRRLRRRKYRVWVARLFVYVVTARIPMEAVLRDQWTALRKPSQKHESIIGRRRRAQRIAQLTGIGYTPRIVALAGLMLRGMQKATAVPLEPQIGFGAGANVAAMYTHREWLPCILIGWFAGGWCVRLLLHCLESRRKIFSIPMINPATRYWDFLGVGPPPSYNGVPIIINRVRPG